MNWKKTIRITCVGASILLTIFLIFIRVISIRAEKNTIKEIASEHESENEIKEIMEVTEPDKFEWNVPSDFVPIACGLDESVQEFVYTMCQAYEIDFYLIMAQMEIESDYQPELISSTNDYGLMQINVCNHEWLSEALGITDFLDPYQSIKAGIYVMSNHLDKYKNVSKALMAYNMGSSRAESLWSKGIYDTKYSTKIINRMKELRDGEAKNE